LLLSEHLVVRGPKPAQAQRDEVYETVSYTSGMEPAARPRSRLSPERLDELFVVVRSLLLEAGYEGLTFDGVASRARTSKATLYRLWGSKSELTLAALTNGPSPVPEFSEASSLDDALGQIATWATRASADGDLRMGVMLLNAAANDPGFGTALRERIIAPVVARLAAVFVAAAERGEIEHDLPLFERLAHVMLTDFAFFPLVSGRHEADPAPAHELLRSIIRPALRPATATHGSEERHVPRP
jgi:AcrR family transcriptional regulator